MYRPYHFFCLSSAFPVLLLGLSWCQQQGLPLSAVSDKGIALPAIRQELLQRVEKDQAIRKQMVSGTPDSAVIQTLRRVDKENREWLAPLVDQHGWLGASQVGQDGAHAAWLLVQHADQDPGFQRTCLDLMSRFSADEVNLKNVAYLTDRVLLAEGQAQRFGTQFSMQDGQLTMQPCEDPENLNQRRQAMGMSSIADYRKMIEEAYKQKSK